MRKSILTVFAFLSLVCAPAISYAQDVKIGVLYPLTGPVAQVGKDAVAAVKTALDIINNSHNIPGMPLAKDAGLKGLGGNLYGETEASGQPLFGTPGEDGLGQLNQGYLEKSNVDVVTEMINLVSAQRAYEVNSKTIKTADELLSMTNNLKR